MFRFPWGDMHSLNLGWFLQKFNELREDWATAEENIDGALDAEIEKAEEALSDVFDARDAAAASATAAAGSATAAAGSATAAGTSATAAQNSATASASSATLANSKATAAGLSEAAAAQSASNAAGSASNANSSANAAAASAANAVTSATAAGTNATAAATSAANAATSANSAAADAARAEEAAESIPEDYSTLSNEVDELQAALLYDEEMVDTAEWTYNNNSALVNNGDGTYTAGTSDYGSTLFGGDNIIPPGKYILFGVPVGISFVSPTTSYGNAVATNNTNAPIEITLTEARSYYVGFRIPSTPSSPVTYIPFLKKQGNKLTAVSNIIAPVLSDMIADTALVVNDFRIVKEKLYKITAPVAAGGTLTPNTNCIETTVANVLKTLLS